MDETDYADQTETPSRLVIDHLMSTPSAPGPGWINENALANVWNELMEIQAHIPCGMMKCTRYPGERAPAMYSKREVKAIAANTLRMRGMSFDAIARTRGMNVTTNSARQLCALGKIIAAHKKAITPQLHQHAEINSPGFCTKCLKNDVFIAMRRVSPSTLICDGCGATRSAE